MSKRENLSQYTNDPALLEKFSFAKKVTDPVFDTVISLADSIILYEQAKEEEYLSLISSVLSSVDGSKLTYAIKSRNLDYLDSIIDCEFAHSVNSSIVPYLSRKQFDLVVQVALLFKSSVSILIKNGTEQKVQNVGNRVCLVTLFVLFENESQFILYPKLREYPNLKCFDISFVKEDLKSISSGLRQIEVKNHQEHQLTNTDTPRFFKMFAPGVYITLVLIATEIIRVNNHIS